jgi:hypothetical protein
MEADSGFRDKLNRIINRLLLLSKISSLPLPGNRVPQFLKDWHNQASNVSKQWLDELYNALPQLRTPIFFYASRQRAKLISAGNLRARQVEPFTYRAPEIKRTVVRFPRCSSIFTSRVQLANRHVEIASRLPSQRSSSLQRVSRVINWSA